MIERRPVYRIIDMAPKLRMFDCSTLRAALSSEACASRWQSAPPGSACHGCQTGRLHASDHNLKRPGRLATESFGACLRCGRTDLRIIRSQGVCISCFNREREWRKGVNRKGKPPATYLPLVEYELSIRELNGDIRTYLYEVRDSAEAVARAVLDLPDGASIVETERPGETVWNADSKGFEFRCRQCGTAGKVLERRRAGGLIERHHTCCQGSPPGTGWAAAPVRQPVTLLSPADAAAILDADPEAGQQTARTPTPYVCGICRAGQLMATLDVPSGRWRVRCGSCGS